MKVVALRQERLLLQSLHALNLIGVVCLALALNGGHVDWAKVLILGEVLVEGVWRVDGVIFLGGVLALVTC